MIGYTLQYDSDTTKLNLLKGTYIFINLLDKINVKINTKIAQETITKLHGLGAKIIVDVNDEALEKHNINLKTLNEIWKIDYLRIDDTKNYKKVVPFLQKVGLAFNSSIVRKSDLELISNEMDLLKLNNSQRQNILWMHNHYPKIGTGLSTAYFLKQNELLKAFGGKRCSFISGDQAISPEYNFLPTLEEERYFNVYLAYLKHTLLYGMDIVFVGDKISSEFDQKAINSYILNGVITIPLDEWLLSQKEFLNKVVHMRKDLGNNFLRIMEAKFYYLSHQEIIITPENNQKTEGKLGMLFLDNQESKQYTGDLSLVVKNIEMDKTSNFVGKVPINYRKILDFLIFDHEIIFKLI